MARDCPVCLAQYRRARSHCRQNRERSCGMHRLRRPPIHAVSAGAVWSSAAWLLPLLIIGVLALAANTLAWPISALVRRRYHASYDLTGDDARAHRLVRIAC